MTQPFFGAQISYQFATMHTVSYEFLMKPEESAGCHQTLSSRVGAGHETRSGPAMGTRLSKCAAEVVLFIRFTCEILICVQVLYSDRESSRHMARA